MRAPVAPNLPPDADLVRQALSGDRNGFQGLVKRHLPDLVGFFRHLEVPSSIFDDIIQETFIKAFAHLSSFDQARPFTTWLLTIGKNVFYDQCRKRATEQKHLDTPEPPPASEQVEDAALKRRTLDELLDSLSESEKFLVQLRIFQDLPFQEIGKILGEPEANVRVRFHRILKVLRQTAGKEGVHGI